MLRVLWNSVFNLELVITNIGEAVVYDLSCKIKMFKKIERYAYFELLTVISCCFFNYKKCEITS